jgi:hypothetical protein
MQNGIFSVDRLATRFEPGAWAFAERQAARIDAHWEQRKQAQPKLFDGKVLLLRRAEIIHDAQGATFRGGFFATNYRNFLAWQAFGHPDGDVYNAFAMAALRSRDGAFLLGEMGGHTANAGQIYFAAGTPDLNDVFGDSVDLAGSVTREMVEETGFSAEEAAPEPGFRIVVAAQQIACIQQRRLALSAEEACARTAAFLAADPDPELARLHAVAAPEQICARMPDFIQTFLRDAFAADGVAGA